MNRVRIRSIDNSLSRGSCSHQLLLNTRDGRLCPDCSIWVVRRRLKRENTSPVRWHTSRATRFAVLKIAFHVFSVSVNLRRTPRSGVIIRSTTFRACAHFPVVLEVKTHPSVVGGLDGGCGQSLMDSDIKQPKQKWYGVCATVYRHLE